MVDLFEHVSADARAKDAPLAWRMAPRSLDEFAGQEHILGPGCLLRRAIEADRIGSIILYGPPGSGKTALARIIARRTESGFERLNAVTSGIADLRELVAKAKQRRMADGRRTIIFVDEIHRFNKAQQDGLLPHVEDGTITCIGATTQNPFFAVNAPLVSRSQIFQLEALGPEHVRAILERALADEERGLGGMPLDVDDDALTHWVQYADGDARRGLTALEIAALTTAANEAGRIHITLDIAEDSIQRKAIVYDGTGDQHYDTVSAFIKSVRGSDPDAALYWLAVMLEAGEDPRFIARRLCILASEDIGNADPMGIVVANAALGISEFIGMPEAQLTLAQATTYLACAPKGNASTIGITEAREAVRDRPTLPVPRHLRDAHYPGAKKLGHGTGYVYPHNEPGHFAPQDHGVETEFYRPSDQGAEAEQAERLRAWRAARARERDSAGSGDTLAP